MKFSGYISRMTKTGRITIPQKVLKEIGIEGRGSVSISLTKQEISIKKFSPICIVTGENSERVIEIRPNIYLSPEGMEILLIKIEEAMQYI